HRKTDSILGDKKSPSPARKLAMRKADRDMYLNTKQLELGRRKMDRDFKDADTPRFKDGFRIGRIGEIFRNELSRMGDLMWTKDIQTAATPLPSPLRTNPEGSSDTDEGSSKRGSLRQRPQSGLSRYGMTKDMVKSADVESKYHV